MQNTTHLDIKIAKFALVVLFNIGNHANLKKDYNRFYISAWTKFINRHKCRLSENNISTVFVNFGFENSKFESLIGDIEHLNIGEFLNDEKNKGVSFGQCAAQEAIYSKLVDSFDIILRFDQDAFPNIERILDIANFITENNIDLLTPGNGKSSVVLHLDGKPDIDLSSNKQPECRRENHSWHPWFVPTLSAGFEALSANIIRRTLDKYNSVVGSKNFLSTNKLTYGDVCKIMGTDIPQELLVYADGEIYLDGPIKSDFWTILCSLNPIVASIVNFDQRSFNSKIQIGCFNDILLVGNADAVLDLVNWVPNIIKNRIVAPFIHIGGSYMSAMHFDTEEDCPELISRASYLNSFYSNSFGAYAAHYCIVNMLCENDKELAKHLSATLDAIIDVGKITKSDFLQFKSKVEHCYREAIADYI